MFCSPLPRFSLVPSFFRSILALAFLNTEGVRAAQLAISPFPFTSEPWKELHDAVELHPYHHQRAMLRSERVDA